MTGKKVLKDITNAIKHPTKHPGKFLVTAAVVVAVGDYLIQPKGKSFVAKTLGKVLPAASAATRHAPVPPAQLAAPGGAAAAAAHAAQTRGYYTGAPFGPGWGRGNMPYMYGPGGVAGGGWPESPAQISAAHRSWAMQAGAYPEVWSQSTYPWQ
jgi:hypothetical protein